MKIKQLIMAAAAAAAIGSASASVTITFNAGFVGGLSSNLADAAGTVSNGLIYGIIVDTTGNGILSEYSALSSQLAVGSTYSLNTADDVLFTATDKTSDSSAGGVFVEGDGTTPGGNGGVSGISLDLVNGAVAGKTFYLVWFDPTGKTAGFLSNAAFVLPADGNTVSVDSAFTGVDPVRPATGITFVPEASTALLGLLGAFGFMRRRR